MIALSALFGSVAIIHSPAVTLALLTETRARGPVARTTLGIVLVADVAVILLFSATLAMTRAVVPATGGADAGFSDTCPLHASETSGGGGVVGGLVVSSCDPFCVEATMRQCSLHAGSGCDPCANAGSGGPVQTATA